MGSELVSSAPLPSYAEQFHQQFPFYLSIGMSFDEYWNEDCRLVEAYRKAHEIRSTRKNSELYLMGAYVYNALYAVAPVFHAFAPKGTTPMPYLDKPFPLTSKERETDEKSREKANREKAKAMFESWVSRLKITAEEGSEQ